METELSNLLSSPKSDLIKKPLEKLIETLKLVNHKKPIENEFDVLLGDIEIWNKYKTNDLGIKKWATEIVNSLNNHS